jgi:hypothetical protein
VGARFQDLSQDAEGMHCVLLLHRYLLEIRIIHPASLDHFAAPEAFVAAKLPSL